MKKRFILLVFLLALAGGGAYMWLSTQGKESTDDAAIEAHIVPIAPKVSGYVTELRITDNQHVKKGDVLLKIDPRDYQVAVNQAQAERDAAFSRLVAARHNYASTSVSAPSNMESAQSQVDIAAADMKNADLALRRLEKLDDNARSRQSLEDAQARARAAHSSYADAQAKLKAAQTAPDEVAASEAAVKELEADVAKADAALEQARINLAHTDVLAPEDGRITRRSVEQGAYVQPGQQLTTIVSDDVWIVANFKETQIGEMKAGQPVDIEIDSYPGTTFTGKVDSIQSGTGARFSMFPPENATGNFVKIVQRVPVKIVFSATPDARHPVGPGMSVIPTVHLH